MRAIATAVFEKRFDYYEFETRADGNSPDQTEMQYAQGERGRTRQARRRAVVVDHGERVVRRRVYGKSRPRCLNEIRFTDTPKRSHLSA